MYVYFWGIHIRLSHYCAIVSILHHNQEANDGDLCNDDINRSVNINLSLYNNSYITD